PKDSQAQKWLEEKFPIGEREEVTVLFARNMGLEGELVVEKFPKLEKIICDSNSKLTSIKVIGLSKLAIFNANACKVNKLVISGCPEIISLNVGNNLLSNTDFLDDLNPEKLTYLSIHSNKFEKKQNLEFLSRFGNLEELYINSNEKFIGSLSVRLVIF
ncbi:9260_t:CDS:1, partial [Ambispora gerdemannii]